MNQEGSSRRRKSLSLEMKSWNLNRRASKQLEHSMENIQKDIRIRRKSHQFETESISRELSEKLSKTTPSIDEHLALNYNRLASWRERETQRLERRFRSLCVSYLDKDPVDPQLEVYFPRLDLSDESESINHRKDSSSSISKESIGDIKLNGSLPLIEPSLQKQQIGDPDQKTIIKDTTSLESNSETAKCIMGTEEKVERIDLKANDVGENTLTKKNSKMETKNPTIGQKATTDNANKKTMKANNIRFRRFSTTGNPLEFRIDKRLSRRSSLAKFDL